jgi:PBP1b-binding outer membrane lipoprotein LpoB
MTVTNTDGCQSTASRDVVVATMTSLSNITDSKIRMWSNGKNVFADFTKMKNVEATIEVYNIIGQKLSSDKFNTSGIYTKALNITEAAYVIMNIRNGDEVMTKKLFVTEK